MNHHEFTEFARREMDRILEMVEAKDADYAGADAQSFASNFYEEADALDITPETVWHVWAYKHWTAITTYCKTGGVKSEPIDGRLDDVIGYALLLKGMLCEQRKTAKSEVRGIVLPSVGQTLHVMERESDQARSWVGEVHSVDYHELVIDAPVGPGISRLDFVDWAWLTEGHSVRAHLRMGK